jgi:hypothetical protein
VRFTVVSVVDDGRSPLRPVSRFLQQRPVMAHRRGPALFPMEVDISLAESSTTLGLALRCLAVGPPRHVHGHLLQVERPPEVEGQLGQSVPLSKFQGVGPRSLLVRRRVPEGPKSPLEHTGTLQFADPCE